MKITSVSSHRVLPVADEVEVVALVSLDSAGVARNAPVDLRWVLDRSQSMDEFSGIGTQSKLDALKAAVNHALDRLSPGEDQVSCVAFDEHMTRVLDTQVIASDIDRSRMKRAIRDITTGGNTALADSLAHAIDVTSRKSGAARRVVVFTDGQVNGRGEKPRCLALAQSAAEKRVPLSVFAVGVSYDEVFLRALVDAAGLGSYYAHVATVQDVAAALDAEISQLRSSAETDVNVSIDPGPGVTLAEVTRFVPQQCDLAIASHPTDRLAALDARGQKYLVRCRLTRTQAGVHSLFTFNVRYRHAGRDEMARDEVFLELSADASRWSDANGTVLATVVNAAGVRAATQGNVPLAKTLFTRSGNAAMVQQLTVLGSAAAANPSGDEGRSLRTILASQAHLPTLGSTPPAARNP